MTTLFSHELLPEYTFKSIQYRTLPVYDTQGREVEGLHKTWIALDNEKQLNSYTTEAVKEVILAFRRASCDRRSVAVVFTAAGTRSFCTGGNTAEYATYYANRPHEYLQYMRLFNDMVTSILLCDKPVICRVNGMRIGGGQEIGMACDFSVAGDHARFGQAGPVHGSAPDGGSTDFLHLYVGFAKAAESLSLCQPWSAHTALRLGSGQRHRAGAQAPPDGEFIPNPMVVTDRYLDDRGRVVLGDWKTGAAADEAKKAAAEAAPWTSRCSIRPSTAWSRVCMNTFPDCTRKTLESLRKKKLEHWFANMESSRSWLALNMNTEAAAGFPAFHFGNKEGREIDFVAMRKAIADGARGGRGADRGRAPARRPRAPAAPGARTPTAARSKS